MCNQFNVAIVRDNKDVILEEDRPLKYAQGHGKNDRPQ